MIHAVLLLIFLWHIFDVILIIWFLQPRVCTTARELYELTGSIGYSNALPFNIWGSLMHEKSFLFFSFLFSGRSDVWEWVDFMNSIKFSEYVSWMLL